MSGAMQPPKGIRYEATVSAVEQMQRVFEIPDGDDNATREALVGFVDEMMQGNVREIGKCIISKSEEDLKEYRGIGGMIFCANGERVPDVKNVEDAVDVFIIEFRLWIRKEWHIVLKTLKDMDASQLVEIGKKVEKDYHKYQFRRKADCN